MNFMIWSRRQYIIDLVKSKTTKSDQTLLLQN